MTMIRKYLAGALAALGLAAAVAVTYAAAPDAFGTLAMGPGMRGSGGAMGPGSMGSGGGYGPGMSGPRDGARGGYGPGMDGPREDARGGHGPGMMSPQGEARDYGPVGPGAQRGSRVDTPMPQSGDRRE